jgi:hypothetical protein
VFPLAKVAIKTVGSMMPQKCLPYLLAFATLGDATQNRTNPICVMLPKEVTASRGGNIASQYR